MKHLIRHAACGAALLILAACGGGSDPGLDESQPLAATQRAWGASGLAIEGGGVAHPVLDSRLARAKGPQRVWVTLEGASLAAFEAARFEALGVEHRGRSLGARTEARALRASARPDAGVLARHRAVLRARQDDLMLQLRGMGAQELARVQVAHNAVAIEVDATSLQAIARLAGVVKLRPVIDPALDLSQTVPYVGAAAAQAGGRSGAGVKVAVIDSGIDYTHRNLGGPGTLAAFEAAYGSATSDARNTRLDGLFPTAKVVAGYDFVGENWPNGPLAPDPDPIDWQGHGTHVADIIAGASADGTHKGVAPGALLVALKACSAVSGTCSGVALLQAMDFALDPNGDGDLSDAVDVINMSLGVSYGQIEDDLTLAATHAVRLGVVVVVSAGNSSNRPYIVGSPSTGVGVISVAQTHTPSATVLPLVVNAPALIAGIYPNTQSLDFAPVGGGVTGDVAFMGRGCPAGSVAGQSGADPVLVNPSGKIALIDRGACAVSLKVDAAVKAGATGVLIGLVAPGDAIAFSYGGGTDFKPSLVIQQSLATAIKARLAAPATVNVSMSNAAAIALVGGVAGTSSRGPSISTQHIKPEIGAPGASVSARVGTGAGEAAFGGTSGAAPMVAGAAALLLEAHPFLAPERIKALLMNSAQTVVYTDPALRPGELAPISRVGAGELRVDRALALTSLAWNREQQAAALSFGALEVERSMVTQAQTLRIENLSDTAKTFTITPSFRFAADEASAAVKVLVRAQVLVPARGFSEVDVRLQIDPARLPQWQLNGGAQGGNGAALNGPEYDGYLTLTAGAEKLSVPWHVLPRRAAAPWALWIPRFRWAAETPVYLFNFGQEVGAYDLFSLLATSSRLPSSALPAPGDNFVAVDLRAVGARYLAAAVCGAPGGCVQFALHTLGRRAHPAYPGGFGVDIDTDGVGGPDFSVYNVENGGFGATGQTLVAVQNLRTGSATAFYFADADLNSGNMIMTVPLDALGVSVGTTLRFDVFAYDNYFSGLVSDSALGLRFTPGAARYNAVGLPFGEVPSHGRGRIGVTRDAVADSRSSEIGVLMMYRRSEREADILRSF